MNATQKTTVQTQETAPDKKLIRPRGEKLRQARSEKLKAERVQEKLAADRFTRRLQAVPGWNLTEDHQALYRQRQFPDSASAASFAPPIPKRVFCCEPTEVSNGSRLMLTTWVQE